MKYVRLAFVILFTFIVTVGCASIGKKWKELISKAPSEEEQRQAQKFSEARYSDQNQLTPSTDRRYKRTTRKTLETGAQLSARSGSLWVMEGQGAYLFSENTVRMIGDPIAVRIEGEPQEQLSTKSDVIADLLNQLEERRKRALNRAQNRTKKDEADGDNPSAAEPNPATPAAGDNAVANRGPAGDEKNFNVKLVPTRVVERMVDGNYRVRGSQPFMIGSREYKVLVSGIVRAEDFNERGISATQLLDPSFDIVSARGAELRQ